MDNIVYRHGYSELSRFYLRRNKRSKKQRADFLRSAAAAEFLLVDDLFQLQVVSFCFYLARLFVDFHYRVDNFVQKGIENRRVPYDTVSAVGDFRGLSQLRYIPFKLINDQNEK